MEVAPLKCYGSQKWTEHGSNILGNNLAHQCFILGKTHQLHITASGGNTTLHPYGEEWQDDGFCAHLVAPEGVVCIGSSVVIHYAIILEGPFRFPKGYQRVSSVLFLTCNAMKDLQKALTIRMHHWAIIGNSQFKEKTLCFMKADHQLDNRHGHHQFWPLDGGEFQMEGSTQSGSIHMKDHFCLVCIAVKSVKDTPLCKTFYAILCQKPVQAGVQEFRICITYGVPSWIEVCLIMWRLLAYLV